MLLVYSFAVYLTIMATDSLRTKNIIDMTTSAVSNRLVIEEYWGSLGYSIKSLFMSISGGQDWGNLIDPLVEETASFDC